MTSRVNSETRAQRPIPRTGWKSNCDDSDHLQPTLDSFGGEDSCWSRDARQPARRTGEARRPVHKLLGLLDDAVMLLLVIWLFPLAMLLVGAPVALLVRLLSEIAHRM